MLPTILLLTTLSSWAVLAQGQPPPDCKDVTVIDHSMNDLYCDQPVFINFLPKTENNAMMDNICLTFFPVPDDPNTFNVYTSTVFCDGSTSIQTSIYTDIEIGRIRAANPFCTFSSSVIGYAGCDTYIYYMCYEYGDCDDSGALPVIGISATCRPLGLSCVQKIEEIVENAGLPQSEYLALPMKLPNRCVTEQLCLNNIEGNFYRALNLPQPGPGPHIPGPVGPVLPPPVFLG